MKKILSMWIILLLFVGCSGDSKPIEPDFKVVEFEEKLNAGENLVGKTVEIVIEQVEPASAFGYNLITGEHLNFVSNDNPEVKVGDTLIVEVVEVQSMLGSFIIKYKKV